MNILFLFVLTFVAPVIADLTLSEGAVAGVFFGGFGAGILVMCGIFVIGFFCFRCQDFWCK